MRRLERIIPLIILLSSLSTIVSGNDNPPTKDYFSKEEMSDSIYLFENLLNQEPPPSIADYYLLFGEENQYELTFQLERCIKKQLVPCDAEKCTNILYNKNISLFYRWLRSSDIIFSPNLKTRKVMIYINNNYTIIPEEIDSNAETEIDALIVTRDKYIPAKFFMTKQKQDVKTCGKIASIKLNNKRIGDLIDQYYNSRGINIEKDCKFR